MGRQEVALVRLVRVETVIDGQKGGKRSLKKQPGRVPRVRGGGAHAGDVLRGRGQGLVSKLSKEGPAMTIQLLTDGGGGALSFGGGGQSLLKTSKSQHPGGVTFMFPYIPFIK